METTYLELVERLGVEDYSERVYFLPYTNPPSMWSIIRFGTFDTEEGLTDHMRLKVFSLWNVDILDITTKLSDNVDTSFLIPKEIWELDSKYQMCGKDVAKICLGKILEIGATVHANPVKCFPNHIECIRQFRMALQTLLMKLEFAQSSPPSEHINGGEILRMTTRFIGLVRHVCGNEPNDGFIERSVTLV